MANLQDRVALITGGGTGIGAACARELAREGWSVAVVGRRIEPLEEVVEQITAEGHNAMAIGADVADPDTASDLVSRLVEAWGGLDLLVNNAAVFEPASADQLERESWQRHFDLNVTAPMFLCQAAHKPLRRRPGAVVNVLSNLATRPVPGLAAYCASKAALKSLTESLALEWASEGIRVVGVSPGVVDTPIHPPGRAQEMAGAHPLGRIGRPEEVAAAVAFLASDRSAWTTGAILDVTGGIHLA